jgi:hypothetical protein
MVDAKERARWIRDAADAAECEHDAFQCIDCFYAMVASNIAEAQHEARAAAFEEAANLADEHCGLGIVCHDVGDDIRMLASKDTK